MFNVNYILFLYIVRNRMFGALERLCAYGKYLTHSLAKHIHVMYNKLWAFHVIYSEHYELSIERIDVDNAR